MTRGDFELLYVPHPVEDADVVPLVDRWLEVVNSYNEQADRRLDGIRATGATPDASTERTYASVFRLLEAAGLVEPHVPDNEAYDHLQSLHRSYCNGVRHDGMPLNVAYEAELIVEKEAAKVRFA